MAELLVARQEISWRKDIPIVTVSNKRQIGDQRDIGTGELPVFFLTGYGQDRGNRLARTVDWLGRRGVYVEGIVAPFDHVPANSDAVLKVAKEVLPRVIYARKEEEGVSEETKALVMGLSQGAGITLVALGDHHDEIGDVALLAPVAMRSEESVRGKSNAALRHQFVRRFAREGFRQPFESTTLSGTGGVLVQMGVDLGTRRWKPKVDFAVTLRLQDVAVEHANRGNWVGFISGGKDGVSSHGETRGALKDVSGYDPISPVAIEVPGIPHIMPNNSTGKELIMAGVTFLQNAARQRRESSS